MKTKEHEWKRLCALVANETDPRELSRHLDELIVALDQRKQTLLDAAKQEESIATPAEHAK